MVDTKTGNNTTNQIPSYCKLCLRFYPKLYNTSFTPVICGCTIHKKHKGLKFFII